MLSLRVVSWFDELYMCLQHCRSFRLVAGFWCFCSVCNRLPFGVYVWAFEVLAVEVPV